jgi:NMD protein affecting ribosome stability and mRNA decay
MLFCPKCFLEEKKISPVKEKAKAHICTICEEYYIPHSTLLSENSLRTFIAGIKSEGQTAFADKMLYTLKKVLDS